MSDKYSFIRYSKNNFTTSEDFISLLNPGIISFSKGFLLKNNLRDTQDKFINFFYDPSKAAIAFQIRDKKTEDSFTIAYDLRSRQKGGSVSCISFFKSLKINPSEYVGRYPYEIIDDPKEGKLYVFALKPRRHGN